MKTKKAIPKWLNFIIREAIIFGVIAAVSGVLILDKAGPTNFRYPLSASPEVKEIYNTIGRWLLLLGYPSIAVIRSYIYVRRKKNA